MRIPVYRYPVIVQSIPWIAVLYTILTLYLTTFPKELLVESRLFEYDKIGHFLMFGGWTYLSGLIRIVYQKKWGQSLWMIFFIGVVFSSVIELVQYILPFERYASFADLTANMLGCGTATLALWFTRNYLLLSENDNIK